MFSIVHKVWQKGEIIGLSILKPFYFHGKTQCASTTFL